MIELKNISKTYQMGKVQVKAVDGVSLKITAGEFVAIMGPSGSGKSTLMHILGLLDRPDKGEYYLSDQLLTTLSDEQLAIMRNKFVGFVFQQFHLLPRLTVLENIELPLVYAGKQRLKEKAKEKIREVGLENRMFHHSNELSGGQQQRVAIARALVNEPLLILADEPTGNLDSKSREEILAILDDLNKKGKTVIVVTHENDIARCAKRIIVMRDGKVISDNYPENAQLPIDTPAVSNMLSVVRDMHQKVTRAEFRDFMRQAVFAIVSHKIRSFLSILGILIGVASVIAMLALGQGAKESIEQQLRSLGSNLLVVRAGSSRFHGVSLAAGTVTRFTFQDVEAIRKMSDVKRVSASVSGGIQLVYADKNWNTQLQGVDVDYAEMRAYQPAVGRFFTEAEVKARAKVAILGTTVAGELFGQEDPIGETIKINLINFRVIGVLPSKGASGFHDQDDIVLVPVTTAMYRVLGKEYVDAIFVEAGSADTLDSLTEAITKLLIKEHHLNKNDDNSFQIRNMADIKSTLEATTKTMSMLLGSIAAISLLVGGIGIMNIMLVSVTERTREIGLRKALGANNRDIMNQFLIEAILMAFIAGIGGIALGAAISLLITFFAGWAVKISIYSVILATVFSLMVGIIFGLWPARQASKLDPIEALRYE